MLAAIAATPLLIYDGKSAITLHVADYAAYFALRRRQPPPPPAPRLFSPCRHLMTDYASCRCCFTERCLPLRHADIELIFDFRHAIDAFSLPLRHIFTTMFSRRHAALRHAAMPPLMLIAATPRRRRRR